MVNEKYNFYCGITYAKESGLNCPHTHIHTHTQNPRQKINFMHESAKAKHSQNVVRLGGMEKGLVVVVKHKDDRGQQFMHALAKIQQNCQIQ